MAEAIKSGLSSNILVSTGGGAWLSNSLLDAYFSCPALDVLAIHAYGAGDFATSALQPYVQRAQDSGKKLIMQEWGRLLPYHSQRSLLSRRRELPRPGNAR